MGSVFSIRPATEADAGAIRTIYNHEVEHTTATFDLVTRTLADQRAWLAARRGAFAAIVAVEELDATAAPASRRATTPSSADPSSVRHPVPEDLGGADGCGDVVGFASLSPYRERAAYRTSVENSIYVRRDRHGRGIGRLLLTHLLDTAAASGFHAVFARIEVGSAASRALHTACGYELVGIEREVGRKFNRWLSVALMQCLLDTRTGVESVDYRTSPAASASAPSSNQRSSAAARASSAAASSWPRRLNS